MKKIQAHLVGGVIFSNSSEGFSLYKKSCFGEPQGEKILYSFCEVLFLKEKKTIEVFLKNKELSFEELVNKIKRFDKKILIKYSAYKDLRKKGYIVKTALKFGADFRVYNKGTKPGKKHAKWILFTEHESKGFTWHEFSSKNRVAHSTKKNLLLGIVDEEGDVTYYEVGWRKI
jgi:tRNA-intron endonuclease